MFFCNPCADERKWPHSAFKSEGKCEMCGNVRICNEIPSRMLPATPASLEQARHHLKCTIERAHRATAELKEAMHEVELAFIMTVEAEKAAAG